MPPASANARPPAPIAPGRALPLVAALPFVAALLLGAAACAPPPPRADAAQARAEWSAWRADRDTLFASDSSPVPDSLRGAFAGLTYFAYDTLFVVAPALRLASTADTVLMATTTGQPRRMVSFGRFSFLVDGRRHQLTGYVPVGPASPLAASGTVFVPFRDATSGRETYGGGRYIDLEPAEDGGYVLDLNRAYHPSCVYDPSYSCPIPPRENTLDLAVTAGERLPGDA